MSNNEIKYLVALANMEQCAKSFVSSVLDVAEASSGGISLETEQMGTKHVDVCRALFTTLMQKFPNSKIIFGV